MYTSMNYFQSVKTEIVLILIVLMPKCNILGMIQIYFWIECADVKMQHFKHYAIVEVMLWHHLNVLSENWYHFTYKYYSTFFQQNATHFDNLITIFDRLSIMKLSWANCLLAQANSFLNKFVSFQKRIGCAHQEILEKKWILAAQLLSRTFDLNVLLLIYICVLDYSFLWKHKILHAFLSKHIQKYNEQHLHHQISIIMSNIHAMNVHMLNTTSMKSFWILFHVSTFINNSKSCRIL